MPASTTPEEAIASIASGVEPIRYGLAWFEENTSGHDQKKWQRIHNRLTAIAVDAEELAGVAYGVFGGAGSNKPPPG